MLTKPFTFVFVNRRNNEARAHISMWAQASLCILYQYEYRVTDTNVYAYRTDLVKIWKTRHKISVDIRIFFTVRRNSPKGLEGLARWCEALLTGGASFPGRGITHFDDDFLRDPDPT